MYIFLCKWKSTTVQITELEEKRMDTLALILSIVGCLNWGLVGIFQFDLVSWIFGGQDALLSRLIYTVIALAGLWCITLLLRRRMPIDGE